MLLLLTCAGLLVGGRSTLADMVAVYAYYLLVVGVVLQLVSFLRHNKRSVDKPHSGDNSSGVEA